DPALLVCYGNDARQLGVPRNQTFDARQEFVRRLRAIKEACVFHSPFLELHPLPALRHVLLKERKRTPQLLPAQHVRKRTAAPVGIRSKDSPAKSLLEVLQRLHVSAMNL
ncbi:MAG TPA: hypothetical protein VF483_02805, partial [Gemmatimonadaceae bacterium]